MSLFSMLCSKVVDVLGVGFIGFAAVATRDGRGDHGDRGGLQSFIDGVLAPPRYGFCCF